MLHVFEEPQLSVRPFGKKFGLEGPVKFLDGHLRPHPAVPCWTETDTYISIVCNSKESLNKLNFTSKNSIVVFKFHQFCHFSNMSIRKSTTPSKWNGASLIELITPVHFLLWRVTNKRSICDWRQCSGAFCALNSGSLTPSNNETGGWFSLLTLIHTTQCKERPCRASCGGTADQNIPHRQ